LAPWQERPRIEVDLHAAPRYTLSFQCELSFDFREEAAMPRRKLLVLSGAAIVLLSGSLATLGAVVLHEPNFYRQARVPSTEGRRKLALECVTKFTQMTEDRRAKKEKWGCSVSETEMNSFFQEVFAQQGEAENLRKLGISSPTVVLEDNQFRIAFRYDTGWFSTIVSYRVKVWLVPKEPNVIAVEFLNARAGGLPITSQTLMQQLCDAARKMDCKVTLYRHEGNAVAVVQIPTDKEPWALLTSLHVSTEKLTIHGKTLEHMLLPPVPKKTAASLE
jgi:hypothetical protein